MKSPIKESEHCGDKVSIDDFSKIDLRVAKIKAVKQHPSADKLLILDVSLGKGEHDVQIVAGIKDEKDDEAD